MYQRYFILNKVFNNSDPTGFQFLVNYFDTIGRTNIFQAYCSYFNIEHKLCDLITFFRNDFKDHIELKPFQWFLDFNTLYKSKFFIVTNGNVLQQKQKIKLIEKYFKTDYFVEYANITSPKPSVHSFLKLNNKFNFSNPLFVGDSKVDQQFAYNACIPFVNVSDFSLTYNNYI